jgi:ApbE superfamily uncharacterized protein (UPF0280 family)
VVQETDLWVHAGGPFEPLARELVLHSRWEIEGYIERFPAFARTLLPWPLENEPAPPLVREMMAAGRAAGVGPMAAVAGAIAAAVGRGLQSASPEVVVENGGDVFLSLNGDAVVGIAAGASPLSLMVGIRLQRNAFPMAVCTSSGSVGHSLSFGRADAVTVVAPDCALADAAATAIGNRVRIATDIEPALDFGLAIAGVRGVAIIVGNRMGLRGELELVPLQQKRVEF